MITLNKESYSKLITQDIEYLMKQKNTAERSHVIDMIKELMDIGKLQFQVYTLEMELHMLL